MSQTYAVARGERALEWQTVFGTDRLPLVSAVPESGRLPGAKDYVPVVLVDFESLTQEQRARAVAHLAAKFDLDPTQVAALLDEQGLPVPVDEVTFEVRNPGAWR